MICFEQIEMPARLSPPPLCGKGKARIFNGEAGGL